MVTRFRDDIGLAPKSVARILRFQRALASMHAGDRPSLAAVAAGCGYYDQAHLNREFLEMAGTTPTTYLAHRLPGDKGASTQVDAR